MPVYREETGTAALPPRHMGSLMPRWISRPFGRLKSSLLVPAMVLAIAPARAQPIPGSEGWLQTPMPGRAAAPPEMTQLDIDLMRCYRSAIATGQFFLGDVSFVLGRCQKQFAAWVAACEHREGQGAPICLLGPEQAVGEALRDAWAHRDNLSGWLASLPPLQKTKGGQN